MEFSAALAADLGVLTQAVNRPGVDVADTLRRLALDAKAAVASFRGLTVTAGDAGSRLSFTTMEDHGATGEVRASLMLPLSGLGPQTGGPHVALILYAAAPGAFVDLAADLAWMTGREPGVFVLDEHVHRPVEHETDRGPHRASVINQALGVLYSRGYTPAEAILELDARAVPADRDRLAAAKLVLDGLSGDVDPKADGR